MLFGPIRDIIYVPCDVTSLLMAARLSKNAILASTIAVTGLLEVL
jgi:hypothetical protein